MYDHDYYLAAQREPEQALIHCDKIVSLDEQGECLLFAATEGQHGTKACSLARDNRWKEACFFEVIDRSGVPKEQAKDSCARTGTFKNRCVYHIIQRREKVLDGLFPFGKEEALATYIQAEIISLGGEELKEDPLSKTLVARITARRFRKKWREERDLLFSKEHCGSASEDICTMAYRFVVRLGGSIPRPCRVPPKHQHLREKNIPRWSDDFHSQAISVWSELCR